MTSSADAGATPVRPRALVAGHGDFAAGLISAVTAISGKHGVLVPFSNGSMSGAEIEGALRAAADAAGVQVVFTDLGAGSCTVAARRMIRGRPDLVLVTGANVAALLDFVFREDVSPIDAAAGAAERGRAALQVVGGPVEARSGN
jgi:PTS system N-acetylgalactosamine-specific IIA component